MYYNITVPLDEFEYQSLAKEVGKDNIVQAIKKVMNETLLKSKPPINKSKIGALPNIKVPDNFDDNEFPEFYENLDKFSDKSDNNKNAVMQIMPKENRPYRLGALPNIKVPDNFDEIEVTDFDI